MSLLELDAILAASMTSRAASRSLRLRCVAARAASYDLHVRCAANAAALGPVFRRRHHHLPRFFRTLPMSGGTGALQGTRVLLATDDVDTRDLLRMLLEWCGAEVATALLPDALRLVPWFRPDIVLIDLPFERDGAFALAGRLCRLPRSAGGGARLVALTGHNHDHRPSEAIEAGFDAQMDEPLDALVFEDALVGLMRKEA